MNPMKEDEFVLNRISLVRKYLSILKRHEGVTSKNLAVDEDLRGTVERYLYLAIQSSIDLAEVLIAKNRFRKAQSMAENFEILAEESMIDKELAEELIKMVGFRNILSHGYHKIDYDIVSSVLASGMADIVCFLQAVESHIGKTS
jgi:uncharacterized protein YutE (UPF0331/DUF86 family)